MARMPCGDCFSQSQRTSLPISSGQRDSPFSSPCVSDASANPPLRPLAPQPQRSPSSDGHGSGAAGESSQKTLCSESASEPLSRAAS